MSAEPIKIDAVEYRGKVMKPCNHPEDVFEAHVKVKHNLPNMAPIESEVEGDDIDEETGQEYYEVRVVFDAADVIV